MDQNKLDLIIQQLNNRHGAYLQEEGKWLAVGFADVFKIDDINPFLEFQQIVKMEVYYMLPEPIREDVQMWFELYVNS